MTNLCDHRLRLMSLIFMAALSCTGCVSAEGGDAQASPVPRSGPGSDRAQVTATIQPIVNGAPLGLPDDQHGIVSIWEFQAVTSKGVEIDEWRQSCTGTLMTNSMVLTAHHCFGSPLLDSSSIWASLNGDFHHFASRANLDGFDVELLTLDDPYELNGSTSGYRRPIVDGDAGQAVMANGYGVSSSPTAARPASSICGSGAVGCPEDPAPLLISSHTTFWDPNEVHHELGIQTNNQNQETAEGDSGSGLFAEVYTRFLDWPLVGVLSSMFVPDSQPGIWHDQYVPSQEIRGWLCANGVGC